MSGEPSADAVDEELFATIEQLCATAFEDPEEGHTLWAFHARELSRSLTPDEVYERLDDGRGVFVVELVWDEDLELIERGEGRVLRSFDELHDVARTRFAHMGDSVRDPSMVASAPLDADGRGSPPPQTSTPWHPSGLGDKLDQ
jgi:hypothetical protein